MNNHLLAIGIKTYDSPAQRELNNPVEEVHALAHLLAENYGFSYEILTSPNDDPEDLATDTNIAKHISKLADPQNYYDKVIIYYAGHGHSDGYWLACNAKENNADQGTYHYAKLFEVVNSCSSITQLLIISDSCYAGKLLDTVNTIQPNDNTLGSRNFSDKPQSSWEYNNLLNSRQILVSNSKFQDGSYQKAYEQPKKGSSIPKEEIREGGSIFSYFLLKFLKNPPTEQFSTQELAEYITKQFAYHVPNQNPCLQDFPSYYSHNFDFMFQGWKTYLTKYYELLCTGKSFHSLLYEYPRLLKFIQQSETTESSHPSHFFRAVSQQHSYSEGLTNHQIILAYSNFASGELYQELGYYHAGLLYMKDKGDQQAAITAFTNATSINKDFSPCYYYLGLLTSDITLIQKAADAYGYPLAIEHLAIQEKNNQLLHSRIKQSQT